MIRPNMYMFAAGLTVFFCSGTNAAEPPVQSAVIGRPFQISASVQEFCAATVKPMMCEQALPLLAALRSEVRDPRWAAPMEALISKSMRVGGKEWMQIRALECRSTRCALEYAVDANDLDHDVDGDKDLERLMEPLGGIVSPELQQGSSRGVIVSVLFWAKRS